MLKHNVTLLPAVLKAVIETENETYSVEREKSTGTDERYSFGYKELGRMIIDDSTGLHAPVSTVKNWMKENVRMPHAKYHESINELMDQAILPSGKYYNSYCEVTNA